MPHVVADLVGAVQQPGKTITQSVIESLRHRALLLVLDNCEHVLDAAAELAEAITTRCADVRILATSRENLAIRGEQVIRLQSLADEDGARLLCDRAVAAGARGELDMPTLARLSHRLNGIPLAIELAAARCASMSPEEVEPRSTIVSGCSGAAGEAGWSATRRCTTPWRGPTSCSSRSSGRCSIG